jgi:SAM-dependent methyltransferase
MSYPETDHFQAFFTENRYILLKNYLYNYLLRKKAVENRINPGISELVLEVGSGMSPVMTRAQKIVYSDLSHEALKQLKATYTQGWYIVADGMELPFKSEVFSHVICSEVLEHLHDDRRALSEISRALKSYGRFTVTFPHRKAYFAADDRFVNHFRRYELREMQSRLIEAGLRPDDGQKVLGPLEKVSMGIAVYLYKRFQKRKSGTTEETSKPGIPAVVVYLFKWANLFYMGLSWLDAKITPRALSSVLLITAIKTRCAHFVQENGFGKA